jgi:hypothetical protein
MLQLAQLQSFLGQLKIRLNLNGIRMVVIYGIIEMMNAKAILCFLVSQNGLNQENQQF